MGEIVFWTIVRTAVIIPLVWFSKPYISYSLWWMAGMMLLYAGIVHPAIIHYNLFMEQNKPIFDATLCSSCKHFDKTAVLCMKHDEHPTLQYLPCDGIDWQPQPVEIGETEEES
ncbi:MAG: hypothetical protein HYV28_12110 [Ignavibacteriales bacterium]|nr:hypothetical protein [Ignavibacteriales bacterium]